MLTVEENCHYFRQKHTNTHHISSYNSSYLAKLDAAFLFLFFFFFLIFNFLFIFNMGFCSGGILMGREQWAWWRRGDRG